MAAPVAGQAGVEIRAYRDSDHDACRELWAALTDHHRTIYAAPHIGGDDPGADFDRYLADPKRQASWVAVSGGAVVGLTGLLIDSEEAEVEPVIVHPEHRRRGIGKELVATVVAEAKQRGLGAISIRPVARNAGALAAFRSMGFTTLGHVELFMPLHETTTEWRAGIEIHGETYDY